MNNKLSIQEELSGKTEMNSENEKDLFNRLSRIEEDGQVIDSLSKADRIGIFFTFFALGIGPLIYYAFQLL